MKIFYGLDKIKKFKNPVVVLGVFDGLHLAHRRILEEAVKKARSIKGTSMLLTFWPHPQKEESIYSLAHRLKLVAEMGIDVGIVMSFTSKFSHVEAKDFIENILSKKISAKHIFVGGNYRFGSRALGDTRLLQKLSKVYNYRLRIFKVIKTKHGVISSTYIRRLIKEGKLKSAEKLLMRPVSILGIVIKGASIARRLGFPTANIDPHHEVLPPSGVYAVRVIIAKKLYRGVCSIGHRPTFNVRRIQHIEVHIFNFKKNIYGRSLEIQFIKKIRSQKKFPSLSVLSAQIKKDVILARKITARA